MNSLILLLALTPSAVSVEEFGAKGDGVTNDAPAIQSAIDYLLSDKFQNGEIRSGYNRGGTLMFSDHKRYVCESPLVIATRNQAVTIALVGETRAYHVGGSAQLFFPYGDKPGIIIETGRDVHIKNLNLVGVNDFSAKLNSDDDYALDENYTTDAVRTERYSPYCAISIDSFENTITRTDRYPGLNELYNRGPGSGSKQVHIEGCAINGWYVGIMVNSSKGNAQGDGIFIRDNFISTCTYAIAIGQTQSRSVDIRDNEFANHKIVFDTLTFGQRAGTAPHVSGGLIDGAKYLFLTGTTVGNLHVSDLYAEVICSLGVIGGVSRPDNNPALISGCQFHFSKTSVQPEAHLISGGNVKFVGCTIRTFGQCLNFQTLEDNTADSPTVEFDTCDLSASGRNAETAVYVNAFTHASWHNSAILDPYWNTRVANNDRHPLTDRRQVAELARVNMKIVAPGETIVTPAGAIDVELSETVIPIGKDHHIRFLGNGQATLRLPDHNVFKVGDIVRGSASNAKFNMKVQGAQISNITLPKIGVITSIEAPMATLSEVPAYFENTDVKLDSLEAVSMKRFHFPTSGKLTSGSNKITDCAISPKMDVVHAWFVGNRIYGEGIPVGAYVTAISGSTITISKAATATNSEVALYDAKYKSR